MPTPSKILLFYNTIKRKSKGGGIRGLYYIIKDKINLTTTIRWKKNKRNKKGVGYNSYRSEKSCMFGYIEGV
jgi:hypothetical protein